MFAFVFQRTVFKSKALNALLSRIVSQIDIRLVKNRLFLRLPLVHYIIAAFLMLLRKGVLGFFSIRKIDTENKVVNFNGVLRNACSCQIDHFNTFAGR